MKMIVEKPAVSKGSWSATANMNHALDRRMQITEAVQYENILIEKCQTQITKQTQIVEEN